MTDQQNDTKESKRLFDPALDLQANLAEAGGSVSGRLYCMDKEGQFIADIQLTARGITARDALDNFMDGYLYGKERYRLSLKEPLPPAAPAAIQPLQQLYSPANPPAPINQPAMPQNPAQPVTTAGGTIRAAKLEIEIRPDGRANLSFYETGHKWADITTVRSIEAACELLSPIGGFTAAHIVNGASYTVNALIDWTPGKTNSKGKPYKDIATIRPA